jgi:hypothetical protein
MHRQVIERVTEVAAGSASNVIKDSVFGALLTVAVVCIIWLLKRLMSVQDQRVEDQVRANEMMEHSREKTSSLIAQVNQASVGVNATLDKLVDAQCDSTRSLGDLRSSIQSLQVTTDSVIRDAVRGRSQPEVAPMSSVRQEVPRGGSYSHLDPGLHARGERGR